MKKHNTLPISQIILAKAFLIFMIIFFLLFSLSGCSSLLEGKGSEVTNSTGIPANSDSDENATSSQTSITNGVTTSIIAAESGNSNGSGSSEDPASTGQSTISETTEDNQKNDTSDSKTKDTGNTNDLETQRYYFQLGIKSFEEAKYVEAQYYLEKIKSDYIILADYIKFYIAKSMLLQKKYDMAAENYRNLIDNFPQSIFQEKANIELGDAYYLKEDFVKAAGQYKIFQTKFPDSGLIPYSLFQSGVCKEKNSNFEEAYAEYKKIYIKHPESDYAKYACENLTRLSEQNGLPVFIPTVDELYARAEKLFSIYYYDMALADFNKIIANSDASSKYPDIYSKTLFKTGMCYFNMNDYANSKKYLDMNYGRFPTGGYADDSLYYLGRCLTNLNASNEAIQTYKMLLEKFPQSNYADDSLYRCGRISYMADDWQNAAFYYQRVIDEYPGGDKLPDVYWELGWIQYRLGEFDSALITFDKMSVSFKGTSLEEKSLFWKAKCLQKLDKQSEAIEIYKKIFSINALSYYGFASAKALEIVGNPVSIPVIDKNLNPENQDISKIIPEIYNELIPRNITDIAEVNHINKAKELLFIEFYKSAAAEIEASKEETDANPLKLLEISTMYLKSKDYENSIAIIQKNSSKLASSLTGNKKAYYYYLFYPFAYKDYILKYSQIYGLEPDFVLAIIREESRFKADAGSHAGAQGLMQIMPATGKSIANQIGISDFNVSMLHDPETSIKMGTYYISQMLGNFGGNKHYALGAYNGGPGAMQKWISKYGALDIDEFIESLTYDETKNYIKKVMASYCVYDLLYK